MECGMVADRRQMGEQAGLLLDQTGMGPAPTATTAWLLDAGGAHMEDQAGSSTRRWTAQEEAEN